MNRGQAYTLEGIIGAIVIASALVIGLQAVDPAPWTQTDPTNPEELRTQSQDLLDAASDTGALHTGIRCSDDGTPPSGDAFMDGTGLANLTANALATDNYRISVEYGDSTTGDREASVVVAGRPGRTSATVTRQVAIFDSDAVLTYDGDECDQPTLDPETLGESTAGFYIDDQHPGTELYAVVTIRVVVW